ncbi:ribonuclease HI [Campylobacter sp. FMV-PI01]|uniref:ribonuclease H n=1 Tax=Campylobacter portucalensis TaxID=2608384 RepID=A0A6L5WGR4_9BACT|nr:ribonuclease HI [Campylobacter portucalensis]MSN96234.1 ribonuclease HI [Campylobacter portucalensis]
MKSICLFSDGSCLGNPGVGGWACILRYKENQKILVGGERNTTNNKMELTAVIMGLKSLKEPCDVEIYTDSSYVANSINLWLKGWIKKDFKNVKNVELWKEFLIVSKTHKIKAFWIKAHAGHPENEECDRLAREFAQKLK